MEGATGNVKRVRLTDDDLTQPVGVDTSDRCWFWSGEQNRWINVISAWIIENDPYAPRSVAPGAPEVPCSFTILAEGDVCMPVATEPLIEIRIKGQAQSVLVHVVMSSVLWRELFYGWDVFVVAVYRMVCLRCGLETACPDKLTPKRTPRGTRRACFRCAIGGTRGSQGTLKTCRVRKIPTPEEVKQQAEADAAMVAAILAAEDNDVEALFQ